MVNQYAGVFIHVLHDQSCHIGEVKRIALNKQEGLQLNSHKLCTCNEVRVVAALSKFHHCIEEIGYIAVVCGSHAKKAKIAL